MRHRSRAALLAGVLAAATTLTPAWPADAGSGPWTHVTTWATVHDHRIDEASGISRSTYSRSLVFLHNDSGDTARFFAVGSNGRTKAVFRVRDVQARDWEDMATGPHHTLWFGDIGDNAENRSEIAVIRVREPRELRSHAVNGRVFRFEYSDGPHNAEALLVRPRTGRLYVVTKVREGAGVYRAPKNLSSSEVNVLTRIADVPLFVTGGDFAPNGRHLVLRTYHDAYLYARFGGSARKVSLPEQQQGEAIGYTRDGRAVKVASEGLDQPIFRVAR